MQAFGEGKIIAVRDSLEAELILRGVDVESGVHGLTIFGLAACIQVLLSCRSVKGIDKRSIAANLFVVQELMMTHGIKRTIIILPLTVHEHVETVLGTCQDDFDARP